MEKMNFNIWVLITIIIVGLMIIVGCSKEESAENTDNIADKTEETNLESAEEKDSMLPESGAQKTPDVKIDSSKLEELIGKPGKIKIFYTHGGICLPCMEMISRLTSVEKNQHPTEIEFHHFKSTEIKDILEELGLNKMESSGSMIIFDQNNKAVWQMFDPRFENVVDGLKAAGFTKQIVKPDLPPDFYDSFLGDDDDDDENDDGGENSDDDENDTVNPDNPQGENNEGSE